MVSMLASSVVDRGFEPRSYQTKDSAKHTALWRKSKDRLARNQDNVTVRVGQHVYPQIVVSVN